jgi:hypothetical protein
MRIWKNDKDVGIACLWTAVIRYHDAFKDRILSFKFSVEAFYRLRDELTSISTMPNDRDAIIDIGLYVSILAAAFPCRRSVARAASAAAAGSRA